MSFLFDLVKSAFLGMLQLLWFGKRKISNSLSVYIKTNTGSTLSVELDPKWDIKNLKEIVAPQMGMAPEDIKIIFAGKELHNSTIIEVSLIRSTVCKGICAGMVFSTSNWNVACVRCRRNVTWVSRAFYTRYERPIGCSTGERMLRVS